MKQRLDKFISSQSGLSRSEAVKAIKASRAAVNGAVCRQPDAKVDTDSDTIVLDGMELSYREHAYYMMNKPAGVVSATEDRDDRTVIDLLPIELRREGLFPAGRLDKDTTGLMIITDDGDYAHRMLSPKKHVDKLYTVTLDRPADSGDLVRFAEGIELKDGTVCKPAEATVLDDGRVEIVISEGKYHQVKRMFAAAGYHVTALRRERIGALRLDDSLAPGEFREMSADEANAVFN